MNTAPIVTVFALILWPLVAGNLSTQSINPKPVPKISSGNSADEWALRGRLLANPKDRKAHEALCSILEKRGDYRRLAVERKSWLEDNPWDSSELISLTTEAKLFLHDPQYAIDSTRRFLSRLAPNDEYYGWANDFLGRQLGERNKYDEAISYFMTALKVEPNCEDYFEHLGGTLVKAGQVDAGIAALKKAVVLNPTSVSLHSQLADAFRRKGDPTGEETEDSAACNLLNNLHKKDPIYSKEKTDPALSEQLAHLARVQIEHGKYAEADATLKRAIQADPQTSYAYLLRARLFERQNQPKEAAAQRQRAKDLFTEMMKKEKPFSASSQPLVILILTHEDFLEVVRIYKSSATPLTTADRAILAVAYFELGQVDNAVAEFDKFFTAAEKLDDAENHFYFAEQLKKAKLVHKAEEHYRKAYEIDPENMTYAYEYEAIKQSNLSSR